MTAKYIDTNGKEVIVEDLKTLIDLVRGRQIVGETLVFDQKSQAWKKAVETEDFKTIVSNLNASPGGELSPEKDAVRGAAEAGEAPDTKTPRRVFKMFGWLELFIGYLIVLVPLSYFIHLGKLSEIPKEIQDLKYLGSAGFFALILMSSFSIYAGIKLWRIRQGAIKTAKLFLFANVFYSVIVVHVIFNILTYYTISSKYDLSTWMVSGMVEKAFKNGVQDTIIRGSIFLGWYLYLTKSKRVRAIYGGI